MTVARHMKPAFTIAGLVSAVSAIFATPASAASFQCFVESNVICRIDPAQGKNTGSCEPDAVAGLSNWIEIDLDRDTFAECSAANCRAIAKAVITRGFGVINVTSADASSWPTMISINLLTPHPFSLVREMGVTAEAMADIVIMTGRCAETGDHR